MIFLKKEPKSFANFSLKLYCRILLCVNYTLFKLFLGITLRVTAVAYSLSLLVTKTYICYQTVQLSVYCCCWAFITWCHICFSFFCIFCPQKLSSIMFDGAELMAKMVKILEIMQLAKTFAS